VGRGKYQRRKRKYVPDDEPLPDTSEVVQCGQQPCGRAPLWAEFAFLAPNAATQKRVGFLCTVHKLEAEADGGWHERMLGTHRETLRRMNGNRIPHNKRVFFTIKPWG